MNVRLALTRGPTLVPHVLYELLRNDRRNALPDAGRWLVSFFGAPREPSPWLSFPTRRWLERTLRPAMTVFEYGAGASTLYFAARVRRVISAEHDSAWYQSVRELVAARGLDNVTLVHAPPEGSGPVEYGCESFGSRSPGYERFVFESYVKAIDALPDDSVDLVVVDGRSRASCAYRAWSSVRRNGFLLLDDSQRPEYACLFSHLDRYERFDFVGVKEKALEISRTTVWRKP